MVLNSETHVSTDSSTLLVKLHILIHTIDSVTLGLDPHIHEHTVLGIDYFTESLEEEHMRVKFALVLMLDTHEHIIILFSLSFIDQ